MEKLPRRKLIIIWGCVFSVFIFFVSGYFVFTGDRTNVEYVEHHIALDEGWDMNIRGETTHNVPLPVYVETKGDETVILSHPLPDTIPENFAITSRNYHQLLNVYIEDELIFSYPNEDWSGLGDVISDEWCVIPLLPDYSGKTIEFHYTNSTFKVFTFTAYIGEFYLGRDNSIVHHIRSQGFVGVIMGIIVCVIGAMALIISFLYRKHTNQSPNTAMGIALLCFGFWLTNRAKMCLFPDHSIYMYWMSVVCLMLTAPFIFLYSHFRNKEFKRTALWAFRACIIADFVLIFSCLFIKYDIEVISAFAYGLSCIALGLNAYSLFLGGFGSKSKTQLPIERTLNRTEFLSNLVFPIFGAFEMINYNHLLWTEASLILRTAILLYAISYMVFVLWRTYLVVQDRTMVTKQLHDSQMELMMGQIQPHFIFNTLSSIRTLIMVDPKVSYDMLYNFSNYLRANIDNATNLDGIKFAAEVEHIKSYANIEKVRFGDRLQVKYDITHDNFIVPPLSIQPLVENAIKHGVCKKVEGGTVLLKSYETPEFNVVEVDDDGVGFNSHDANRVFNATGSTYSQTDPGKVTIRSVHNIIETLDLIDADGNPIKITDVHPTSSSAATDLSGNGSEQHQSKGMLNILLRLKEMANAKVEIHSKEGYGTRIIVYFPKDVEMQ